MGMRTARAKKMFHAVGDAISNITHKITDPSTGVEPKQHLRVRMLAAFLFATSIISLAAAIYLINLGFSLWIVTLATSIALVISYLISRSRYYKIAMALAVIIPAVPVLYAAVLKLPQVNSVMEMMWLAVPVLASDLILKLSQSLIVAFCYIAAVVILTFSGFLGFNVLVPLTAFILIIIFFTIAFAAIRKADLASRRRCSGLRARKIVM